MLQTPQSLNLPRAPMEGDSLDDVITYLRDLDRVIAMMVRDLFGTDNALSGYIPLSQKAAPSGVATLDSAGKVPESQLPPIEGMVVHGNEWHDPDFETPAGAQAKVDAHATRTDNPHQVTAAQVGAVPVTGGTMTGELTVPKLYMSEGALSNLHVRELGLLSFRENSFDVLAFKPPTSARYLSGGVWTSITVPADLFVPEIPGVFIIQNGWAEVELLWNNMEYTYVSWLHVWASTQGNRLQIVIDVSSDGSAWTNVVTTPLHNIGWPGAFRYLKNWNNAGKTPYMRMRLIPAWDTTNTIVVYRIAMVGLYPRVQSAEYVKWRMPLHWDKDKNLYVNGNKIWHAGNDGAGSGLDADMVDSAGVYVASDSVLLEANTERSSTTRAVLKQFRLNCFGSVRVKVDAYYTGTSAAIRVVDMGAMDWTDRWEQHVLAQAMVLTVYTTHTFDINGVRPGMVIGIWVNPVGGTVYVRNAKVCGSPGVISAAVLQD